MPAPPKPTAQLVQKAQEPSKTSSSFYIPIEKLPGFQSLVGGIPRSTITAFLGAPGSCKSSMAMHLAAEMAKSEKGNILVFDTENKLHVFIHLAEVLSERYGMDINVVRTKGIVEKTGSKTEPKYETSWEYEDPVSTKGTNLFIVHCPDISDITTMFGRGVDLKLYESGKFKIIMRNGAWADSTEEVPISQFFTKHKCKVLVIDSVTNPIDEIPAVSENFPARTDLTQSFMIQVHKIAAFFNVPVLATFHETKNETNPFSKDLDIEGGKAVKYNLAFIIYMLKENEMGLLPKGHMKPRTLASDQRAMYIARHGDLRPPWKDVRYFTITARGLVDGLADNQEEEETKE